MQKPSGKTTNRYRSNFLTLSLGGDKDNLKGGEMLGTAVFDFGEAVSLALFEGVNSKKKGDEGNGPILGLGSVHKNKENPMSKGAPTVRIIPISTEEDCSTEERDPIKWFDCVMGQENNIKKVQQKIN